MKDYENLFKTDEMQKIVKQVELTDVTRQSNSANNKAVNFTLVLSTSGALVPESQAPQYVTVTDANGQAVTNSSGEVATTNVNETTTEASSN